MNVKGPGQPPAPGVPGPETSAPASSADRPEGVGKAGGFRGPAELEKKAFADQVGGARPVEVTRVAAGSRPGDVIVKDLAADLGAGRVTSQAAVEKLVDRVVARQLGPEAPAGVREQVRAALQDAIETDPLLADKLRQLE